MTENKSLRRPVVDPVMLALKSRRFIVALAALIVGVFTLAIPDLHPLRGELLTLIITLALAVIGGYTVEDAARAGRENAATPPEDLHDLVKDVLDGILDELADSSDSPDKQTTA